MRRLIAAAAGLVLLTTVTTAVTVATAPVVAADPSTEYVCSVVVSPPSQSVTVGQNAYFSVQRNVCSRATHQFLYTDPNGTYWSSTNSSIASVGSAGNFATPTLGASTGPNTGTVTITATAQCCSLSYGPVQGTASLTVNPPPFSVYISGVETIRALESANCTWYAVVTGGVQPYSYVWTRNGSTVSYDDSYSSSNFSSGFGLQVQVTGANGAMVGNSLSVGYSPSVPGIEC